MLSGLFALGVATGQDLISFDLGPFNMQPAELAKFTTLLMLAVYLAEEDSETVSYPRFLGGLVIVGAPAVLVIIQPDLGSASVIVSLAMGIGTLNCFLTGLFPSWLRLWAILNRPMFLISCVIFLFESIPEPWRTIGMP